MLEIAEIESLRTELIANWTDNFNHQDIAPAAMPDYLKNHFLINHIAMQSNTIIQIFDMDNFKTVYTSPNCLEVTGFTDIELNNTGFVYWLRTIPLKQILFYVKSAKFINEKIKVLEKSNLTFSNQCINLAFKNKAGENRSMVSTNSCIEWKDNKQKYQLILWRDMTEKFKNKEFAVRYVIGGVVCNYFSNSGKFKLGELLTDKEFEIIKAYKTESSSKKIAESMKLSNFTVDNHKKNLIAKLNTNSMDNVLEILNFVGIL
jgi:DNA-binding CsgD family transcriptional regulator